VDHDEPPEPDQAVEALEEFIDGVGVVHPHARAPRVCGVEAEPESLRRNPARRGRVRDLGGLLERGAERPPAAGRVLEDEHRPFRRAVDRAKDLRDPVGDAIDPFRRSRAAMRARVDVHESRAVPGRGTEVRLEDPDRIRAERRIGTRQVHEVRGVDGDRSDVEGFESSSELLEVSGRCGPALPRGRVVGEDLDRPGADGTGSVRGTQQPAAEREVDAKARLRRWAHSRIVRWRPMDDIPPGSDIPPVADIPPASGRDEPAFESRVLRAFIRKGRLVSLPARERKRRVVLRYILDEVFSDLVPVDERDVNMRLALWHPDVAALRRYLVDAGLVTRAGMVYRRAVPLPDRPDAPTDRPGGPPFV